MHKTNKTKAKLGDIVNFKFLGYPKTGTIVKIEPDNAYTVQCNKDNTKYPRAKFYNDIKSLKKLPAWYITEKTGEKKIIEEPRKAESKSVSSELKDAIDKQRDFLNHDI